MYRTVKHIIAVYLLVAVVFATSGAEVFSSFCACQDETRVSFSKHECCCESEEQGGEAPGTHRFSAACCGQRELPMTFTTHFVPSSNLLLTGLYPVAILIAQHQSPANQVAQDTVYTSLSATERTIPPRYGRELVCFVNSLKIPVS